MSLVNLRYEKHINRVRTSPTFRDAYRFKNTTLDNRKLSASLTMHSPPAGEFRQISSKTAVDAYAFHAGPPLEQMLNWSNYSMLWYLDIFNMRVRRSAIRKTRWTRILFIAYNPVQDPLAPQCVTQHVDQNAVDWSSDYAQVIGRDRYGVFPLRGKILNVSWLTQRGLAFWRHFQKLDDSGCKKIV